jgi:hypothetical protein
MSASMPQRRPHNFNTRPMPDDFPQLAADHSNKWLVKHYGADKRAIVRWREEAGVPTCFTCRAQPIPAEFYEFGPVKPNAWLMEHFGIGNNQLWRWRKVTGIRAPHDRGNYRPIPADFARVAPGMTATGLRKHYRTCEDTARRWAKESGIELATRQSRDKGMFANRTKSNGLNFAHRRKNSLGIATATRALKAAPPKLSDIYERAADFLRKDAVIFRCDINGKQVCDGFFWRYGNRVLEADELLQRAYRHGFEPDAWKRVAA